MISMNKIQAALQQGILNQSVEKYNSILNTVHYRVSTKRSLYVHTCTLCHSETSHKKG